MAAVAKKKMQAMGKRAIKRMKSLKAKLNKRLNIRKKGWDPRTEIFFDRPTPDWLVFAFIMTPAVLLSAVLAHNYTASTLFAGLAAAIVYFCISVVIFGMNYHLTREELRVFIGPFKVRVFKLDCFESASYGYPNVIHEHWTVRFSNHITLRKKKGILRSLVITPSDPNVFMEQLRILGVKKGK